MHLTAQRSDLRHNALLPLELRPYSHRERPSVIHEIQRLVTKASVCVVHGIGQVECFEERTQMTGDVVLSAEVQFGRAREIHRLRREIPSVLLLAKNQELGSLPLDGEPRLQLVPLVEADQIRRVAEAGKRE